MRADAQELIAAHAPEGDLLKKVIEILEQHGIHSTPKVPPGLFVNEILAETSSGDSDLVIVGVHLSQGSQRFLLEIIARQIMTKIRSPVLVLREKYHFLPIG